MTPPRASLPLVTFGKEALSLAIALWPLTGTLLGAIGLLAMATRT